MSFQRQNLSTDEHRCSRSQPPAGNGLPRGLPPRWVKHEEPSSPNEVKAAALRGSALPAGGWSRGGLCSSVDNCLVSPDQARPRSDRAESMISRPTNGATTPPRPQMKRFRRNRASAPTGRYITPLSGMGIRHGMMMASKIVVHYEELWDTMKITHTNSLFHQG